VALGRRFYYRVFKNNLVYFLGLVLLKVMAAALRPFPLHMKFSFGRLVGDLWYLLDFPDRELCRRDMAAAFGQAMPASVRQRTRHLSMANMMAYLFESYFSSSLEREELLALVRSRGWAAPLLDALESGRGAIVLTGHFCNEALLCYLVAAHGRANCIAKYQRVFNKLMVSHRRRMNVETLQENETTYDRLLEVLGRNEILLATIDRPLKRVKGVCVSFFGHTVTAPYYPVDLARISGAPLFVAFLTRHNGRYDMHMEGPIRVPCSLDERRSRESCTQEIHGILEQRISSHPHEWQWHNKRLAKRDWGVPRYADA
jgi:KDO2-lipid IV(A) lauroyltransferase